MKTIKAGKRVNREQLYEEIVAANPELAPTPTGPDGKLEAKLIIEQVSDQELLIHLPDDVDVDEPKIEKAVKDHKRKPEKTVDPVADAMKVVKAKADKGDDLAKAIMTLLGQPAP